MLLRMLSVVLTLLLLGQIKVIHTISNLVGPKSDQRLDVLIAIVVGLALLAILLLILGCRERKGD